MSFLHIIIVVGDYFLIHEVFFQNLFVEILFHCVFIAKFLCKVARGEIMRVFVAMSGDIVLPNIISLAYFFP